MAEKQNEIEGRSKDNTTEYQISPTSSNVPSAKSSIAPGNILLSEGNQFAKEHSEPESSKASQSSNVHPSFPEIHELAILDDESGFLVPVVTLPRRSGQSSGEAMLS